MLDFSKSLQPFIDASGYQPKTTFWTDFSIADRFGAVAVRDTYKRAFDEWSGNYEYLTELVMILNWKLWQHYDDGDEGMARVYDELWRQADEWALKNLQGEEKEYFIATLD